MTAPRVIYHGVRTGASCFVWRDDGHGDCQELPPRHDVRNHSPDGYDWGYPGSGPAQLALALTLDVLSGDVERARVVYQEVKWRLVARLTHSAWTVSADQVLQVIWNVENEQAAAVADLLKRPSGGADA